MLFLSPSGSFLVRGDSNKLSSLKNSAPHLPVAVLYFGSTSEYSSDPLDLHITDATESIVMSSVTCFSSQPTQGADFFRWC